ncbi:alpha-L-fucosidase [Maribellus maritimus]|nr:alpha-L-fucosidase [Maribellus maritimus]
MSVDISGKTSLIFSILICLASYSCFGQTVYISPIGSDNNQGTHEKPFGTLKKARDYLAELPSNGSQQVVLKDGVYHLEQTFLLLPQHSGEQNAQITYRAENEGQVIISGAKAFEALEWKPFKKGIYQARVSRSDLANGGIDELWVGDIKLWMARYPNRDTTAHIFDGVSSWDELNDRAKNYNRPQSGFLHSLHASEWGSVHYKVSGFENGELQLEGGWQQNRNRDLRKSEVMIEHIFEELDDPGEWFFDDSSNTLYLIPPKGVNLKTAEFYSVHLTNLVEYRGTAENPVKYVHFEGIRFQQASRVFMDEYEPLLRGDWSINRSGAVFMAGTENCEIRNSYFYALGGNGVFFSNYNRKSKVSDSYFDRLGESAICFVGNYNSTRSNPIGYNNSYSYDTLDLTPGPKGKDYPQQCIAEGNLIYAIGRVGKQTAGVFISMSEMITARHNTIYHVPRSGITINDGSWGGHVIEYNHIFNSVIETADHGPFNSWGRDRFWMSCHHGGEKGDEKNALEYSKLDNYLTTIIRNNRFEHGNGFSWGIDLDDGTSNYHLYNNLLLGCSYKLREGFYRVVENNISIGSNPPGKHVSFFNNQDIIRNNIHVATDPSGVVFRRIIDRPQETKMVDYNLYYSTQAKAVFRNDGAPSPEFEKVMSFEDWQSKGMDQHSIIADPMFVDPINYDFRVKSNSPALEVGFKNFSMKEFGVTKPSFLAIVERDYPIYRSFDPSVLFAEKGNKRLVLQEDIVYQFIGSYLEDLNTQSERSVAGVGVNKGVFINSVDEKSLSSRSGLKAGDAILEVNDAAIESAADFMEIIRRNPGKKVKLHVVGDKDRMIVFTLPEKYKETQNDASGVMELRSNESTFLYGTKAASNKGNLELRPGRNIRWKGNASVLWDIKVRKGDKYELYLTANIRSYGEGKILTLRTDEAEYNFTLAPTAGPFKDGRNFERVKLSSEIDLSKGIQSIVLSTSEDSNEDVLMDFRSIELLPVSAKQQIEAERKRALASRSSVEWMNDAGYGLMFHWTSESVQPDGSILPFEEAVNEFNVKAFAEMVEETGAGYVMFTIGHAESYCPAPIESWEKVHPGQTTERDLIDEIANALDEKGIKFMCYINGPLGFNLNVDQSPTDAEKKQFVFNFNSILSEMGLRYDDKIAGYWFDSWYQIFEEFPEVPFEEFNQAAKTGNNDRVYCLNSWIYPTVTPWQDYWAGEVGSPIELPKDGYMEDGPVPDLPYHTLLRMDAPWVQKTKEMIEPRFDENELINFISGCKENGGMVTINLGIYQDGTIGEQALSIMREVKSKLNVESEK